MEEIKVIKDASERIDITRMTEEDKKALFETIMEKNPQVGLATIDNFSLLLTEQTTERLNLIKPTIVELLLRKVIQLGNCNFAPGYINNLIVPVIVAPFDMKNYEEIISENEKTGGAKPFTRVWKKTAPKASKDIPHAIKVRFDSSIFAISISGLEYITSTNEELYVVGLSINTNCNYKYKFGSSVFGIKSFWEKKFDADRLLIGNYDNTFINDKYFKLPKYKFQTGGISHDILYVNLLKHQIPIEQILSDVFDFLKSSYESMSVFANAYFMQTMYATSGSNIALPALIKILRVEKPQVKMAPLERLDDPLLSIFKDLPIELNNAFTTNILMDLNENGLLHTYNLAKLLSPSNSAIKAALGQYNARRERLLHQAKLGKQLSEERDKETLYRIIAKDKFGKPIDELIKAAPKGSILTQLKPAEKKIVEAEYNQRIKYFDAVINNKCPHVRIAQMFRRALKMQDKNKYYTQLKAFFGATSGMITCSKCKFDIMCEHTKVRFELENDRADHKEIASRLLKFVDNTASYGKYFCKICHEVVSSGDIFEGDSGATDVMNEDLRNQLYGEIMFELRYIKFTDVVNINQFVNTIRSAIYPYIAQIEKQLMKSRTASADEIKAKKKLYMSIYCFAYLIHIINNLSSKKSAQLVNFKNFKGSSVVDMIKHVLAILISSKNIIINSIQGITPDLIKTKLIEAYKLISSKHTGVGVQQASDVETIIITASMDPVYNYMAKIYIINKILHRQYNIKGMIKDGTANNPILLIEDVLGRNIKQLEHAKYIYSEAPKIDLRGALKGAAKGDSKHNSTSMTLDFEFDIEKLKKLHKYTHEIPALKALLATDSWNFFSESLRNKSYLLGVPKIEEPPKYDTEKLELLKLHEKNVSKLVQAASALNIDCSTSKNNRRYKHTNTKLGRIYDENGFEHEFKIYLLEKSGEKNKNALLDIIKTSGLNEKIIDKKCSICGVLKSTVDALSESKIIEALSAQAKIENFFRFYENRCPNGNLHELIETKCKKCGIETHMIVNHTSPQSKEYYKKYLTEYNKTREEYNSSAGLEFVQPVEYNIYSNYKEEIDKWVFNYDILLELGNKIKINHRLLTCLGAIEGADYAQVVNGVFVPREIENKDDTRIYTLNGYVKQFLIEYNQLRYFNRSTKPNTGLLGVVEASGISREKISDLEKLLVDIYDDHNKKFIYFASTRKPREIIEYCIQKLCYYALLVYDYSGANSAATKTLRENFVKYYMTKIIRSDELVTQNGQFNWGILFPDQNKIEMKEYDNNLESNDTIDESTDDIDDQDKDFGSTNDAFRHTEDLDVEEEYTGEDDSNQVKVEGYELD